MVIKLILSLNNFLYKLWIFFREILFLFLFNSIIIVLILSEYLVVTSLVNLKFVLNEL